MEAAIKMFKALSDETRLRIYLLLLQGELCVCELEAILKIEQSRISHALRILKEADLISNYKTGKWNIYSANQELKNNKIIQSLEDELKLFDQDLNNFKKYRKKIYEKN
ncbi:ArsR family transcriptional regulator [Candidatus Atribacteria bacterium 1244-E10-H5-B2]|nr:MAG: ArsR family transcriptional regulator [Candidatus Atribacteria bacterium 1244-E10-H5-B2]